MIKRTIDINADLGEGTGNDSELMPLLSSCNIACGGHAGNASTMQESVHLAQLHKVKIGAHPSFPDVTNFGRVPMEMAPDVLLNSIESQITNLIEVLRLRGAILHHIKPHGALYNMAAKREDIAEIIIKAVERIDESVCIYVPYNSVIAKMAKAKKIKVKYEAFADRAYNDDLSLVSRQQKGATISNAAQMFNHVFDMINNGEVKTIHGHKIPIKADTFCIHSDQVEAVHLLKTLRLELERQGIGIEKLK